MLYRMTTLLAGVTLLAALCVADTWNKKTILTVSEPVMVGQTTLQPGKYVMKLVDSLSYRHIVRITNERENQVITTILAIPNYRLKPTGDTAFEWWETPAGNPKAMRAWFYPGDNFGQEFVYPKGLAAKIAVAAATPVPSTPATTEAEMKTAPVTVVEPSGQERPFEPPKETPVLRAEAAPAPAPVPAPEPAPEPAQLPETASPFATIGLIGLSALAAGLALRCCPR